MTVSGFTNPGDDTPDYACTQAQFAAVEKVHKTLDDSYILAALPDNICLKVCALREELETWMDQAWEQGVARSTDTADRYGV